MRRKEGRNFKNIKNHLYHYDYSTVFNIYMSAYFKFYFMRKNKNHEKHLRKSC